MRGLFMIKLSQVRFTSLAETTYLLPNSALGVSQPSATQRSVPALFSASPCHNESFPHSYCKRNIEMTPRCKIEVTHPRVLGSREVRRGGVVDGVMVTVYITARQRCATG